MISIDSLRGPAEAALGRLVEPGASAPDSILVGVDPGVRERLAPLLTTVGDRSAAPAEGAKVGGFDVHEVLSRAGAALCLRVSDPKDRERSLVLKEIDAAGPAARVQAIATQIEVASSGSHAAALPIGFEAAGGRVYVVRPFIAGVTLAKILEALAVEEVPPDSPTWRLAAGARGGGANVTGAKMVCRIGQFSSAALADVHAKGAVHGALKPENLICDDTVKPTLVDFGCGHPSAPFEAPEVIGAGDRAAARGPAADLYALGVIMHRCLTRKPLFGDGDVAYIEQATLSQKPISPLKVNFKASNEMTTITLALLEKDAKDRYASAADLKADLDRYHKNEPIQRKQKGLLKRLFG